MTPTADAAREEDAARTWAMMAHLSAVANIFFPFAGLIGAIVVYSARRHDPSVVRDNARNAINMQITLCIINVAVFAVALVDFASLFLSVSGSEHDRATVRSVPWQMAAYAGCILALMLVNVTVAIVACFGARAAYLGRVFRYPFAIPFVR